MKKKNSTSTLQNAQLTTTITAPPSFYETDMEKWNERFTKPVKEREEFKKKHYVKLELTPLTLNTNLEDPNLLYRTNGMNTTLALKSANKLN